ncbi:MAG: SDR family oxidoreductase [Phycisphaerales bacterium]|nr:SDR family oxidoreductase [Phycisphaerales bacterium]
MSNYLVTGGAGFIGSHLVHRFVQLGHSVRVIDDFSSGNRVNLAGLPSVDIVEGDLRNIETCLAACDGIEMVFHEAAVPSVPRSVDDPMNSHTANIDGTFNLLLAAVRKKCRRVIYAASSSAYGDAAVSPKHEELKPAPLSPYAVQKLTGELYGKAFYECFGLETLSVRYFNVFGPRQDPKSQYAAAIPAFVTAIMANSPPIVYGDGEQTRDFTFIDNVVHGNVLAANAKRTTGEAVNVACGESISVNLIIARINELLGKKVRSQYLPPRTGDVKHSLADIRRAKELIGYEPIVPFDEGLRLAIDYYASMAV